MEKLHEFLEQKQIRRALEQVMSMGQLANTYFSDQEPWAQYKTDTEKSLEKLKKKIKEEEYFSGDDYDLFEKQYDIIIEQAKNQKIKNQSKYKEEIKEILTGEITSRYYYQRGRIKSTLLFDEAVKESLDILKNTDPSSVV